jgi:antirestriction protein ArdC
MAGKDRLSEAHERLTAAVESLVSGEDWQQLLALAARLHRYSPNNCMLIRAQRPDATWLAGYRRWQALGRQVRKGEKGVAILAPIVSRRRPVDTDDETERPGLVRVLRGFTFAHIFDASQTDGPPLPDVAPALLDGDAPAELWEHLAAQVAAEGFALARADCRPANGVTDFFARTVVIRDDVAGAQAAKTLAHELAHVLLHDGTDAAGCRGRAEVEAESVAYLVCTAAGLDTDGYSFPYVASWAGGDPDAVRATADATIGCARRILAAAGLAGDEQHDEAAWPPAR